MPFRTLCLLLLGVLSPDGPRAEAEGPSPAALGWAGGAVLIVPDPRDGVLVWAVKRGRGTEPGAEFLGRFDPPVLAGWVASARGFVNGTSREPSIARDLRGAALALSRGERDGDSLRISLVSADRFEAFDIPLSRNRVIRLLDLLERAVGESGLSRIGSSRELLCDGRPSPGSSCPSVEVIAGFSYPEALWRNRRSGEVWLSFVVDTAGRPLSLSTQVLWSDDEAFVAAATDGLARFRFRPATRAGRPVPARVYQRITFAR